MWRGPLRYARSTSNHPSVKLRRLKTNPIFNQPKHHFRKSDGANCSFTYPHKKIVEIRPRETNNGLVGLVLDLHHLFHHRLSSRAFPVTKKITITRLNSSMEVSVGSSPTVIGYVSRILELQFIALKLPNNRCHFNFQHVNWRVFFPLHKSQYIVNFLNRVCQLTCIQKIYICNNNNNNNSAIFCVSKVED